MPDRSPVARTPRPAPPGAPRTGAPPGPERVVFLLLPDFTHLAFSCAVEPLRLANHVAGRALYDWALIAEGGGAAISSNGLSTGVDGDLRPLARDERLFVVSGARVERHVTPGVLAYLRRERTHGGRIGSICSGAYVLAEAGLLGGVPTAIHWAYHDLMAERFPDVDLKRDVFVADARHPTAAGGTAAADLMLHLIAQRHGGDLAAEVADQMLYNAVRDGPAPQRMSVQGRHGVRNPHVAQAARIFADRIEDRPTLKEVAAEVGVSTRQLERLFDRYLGISPKRYAIEQRLTRARNLILQTEAPLADIALACGFATPTQLTRAYRAQFGQSPSRQRPWRT